MKLNNKATQLIFTSLLSIHLVAELCHCNTVVNESSSNYYNVSVVDSNAVNEELSDRIYTNRFAVRIKRGSNPDDVAIQLGYINTGKIGNLDDYYLFIAHHIAKRSIEPYKPEHFDVHEHVEWFEQQSAKRRVKRDLILDLPSAPPTTTSQKVLKFSDPLFDKQWYFNRGARGGYDMNVAAVWKMGITGKGVVLTILDDGVQADHPDLIKNYDKNASYDINGNDDNPTPQDNGENKHGTRCAGEIAGEAGNEFCGVGVAYNSGIGGVRMLDGTVTDEVEARALGLNPNHIDVYSASWGPDDNGKTVDGPGHLAAQAFINGVRNGRKGKFYHFFLDMCTSYRDVITKYTYLNLQAEEASLCGLLVMEEENKTTVIVMVTQIQSIPYQLVAQLKEDRSLGI